MGMGEREKEADRVEGMYAAQPQMNITDQILVYCSFICNVLALSLNHNKR